MKSYCCPYCGQKMHRDKLTKHIEKEHDDLIPEGYTSYRVVYDLVNNKHGHGTCTECGADTPWSEKRQKYARLCGKKECYEKVRDRYRSRMLKTYGRIHLLDDPQHQEKMLSHRKIAGTYTWSDGTKFTYMGSYEKEFMEFLDKVMEFKSNEIVAPGPILEYEFKGKKLHWITDFLIIPFNLLVEVKDGSSNPNKRSMPEYRAKQVAKEKMVTNMGTFSYLRLTNNEFNQFMSILAELKMKVVEDEKGPLYRIHEDAETGFYDEEKILRETTFYANFGSSIATILRELDEELILIKESGRYLDDPEKGGESYYEAVTIETPMVNRANLPLFEAKVLSCIDRCRQSYKNQIHWRWINPFNHLEGASVGVRTSQ